MQSAAEDSYYEIRIKGHLDGHWASWFDSMSLTSLANGETVLSGVLPDQSALLGVVLRILDLGMPLLSVQRVEQPSANT